MDRNDSPASRRAQVLLAEDDRELRHLLAGILRKDGYRVIEAESGYDLLERLADRASSRDGFDLIISDNLMPGSTGLDALEKRRNECEPRIADTPTVLITAFGDRRVYAAAERLGAVVFDKPFDIDDLRAWVARAVPPVDDLEPLYRDYGGAG